MNLIDKLKEIDIVSFLQEQGYKIEKETTAKVWFLSPFRNESSPSFCVHKAKNKWVDYGSNKYGDIIDLVCELESCDTSTAMEKLNNKSGFVKFEPIEVSHEPLMSVFNVSDQFLSPDLISYLHERKVPETLYKRYLKEVKYRFKDNPEKHYTGIGFKNDEGGWEIRSSQHKYSTAPKHYTTFKGDGLTLNLWEGFINFCSTLAYFEIEQMQGDSIVLNGLGMIHRLLPELTKYKKINCFLDLGVGADNTMDLIRSVVGYEKVYDHRYLLPEGMDFNDYWISLNK